jgi:uncharacterized protein (TIGR02678 family)
MIAEGVRDIDLAAYQRAARLLLVHPLVTRSSPDADALPLVRRFGPALARDFDTVAGYRLELGTTCARLVKRADRLDPTQRVQPRDRKPFDRRRYSYLCLVLGALGRTGPQLALTELADALRRRAAEVDGLGFDPDQYRHRLAFVDVVLHLEALGILRPVDVSSVTWLKDPGIGEVLYDVDRDAAHQLFVPPRAIQHVRSASSLLADEVAASRDTRRMASRQRLARLVLEHPVVYVDDLSEADRAYLLSQARSLGDDLARLTGAALERRAEGVALVDTTGGFSDRRFPTGGTPAQTALLLADAIADAVAGTSTNTDGSGDAEQVSVPTAMSSSDDLVTRLDQSRPTTPAPPADFDAEATPQPALPDDLEARTGPFVPHRWLAQRIDAFVVAYGKAFAGDLRDDPRALLRAAVDVLVDFDLVRRVPGGIVARPAIARFREVRVETVDARQPTLIDIGGER